MNKNNFNYFTYSKNIITSLLFIFPFILLYEGISFLYFRNVSYQIRNSADVILRNFFQIFGDFWHQAYTLTLVIAFLVIYFINKDLKSKNLVEFKFLIIMLFEGLLYGILLFFLLNNIDFISTNVTLYQSGLLLNLYLSIGAGIWEEILFRLIIFSSLYKLLKSYMDIDFYPLFLSVIISSIIFSLFHYIGESSYAFDIYSFTIRFIGGVFLSLLYNFRGFGIVSMAHISYDFILISLPLIYLN